MRNIINFKDGGYLFYDHKKRWFTVCGRYAHEIYFSALRRKYDLSVYFK